MKIFEKYRFPFCALFVFPLMASPSISSATEPSKAVPLSVHSSLSYTDFLEQIREEALRKHLAPKLVIKKALSFAEKQPYPNKAILKKDRNQPEFHWSWKVYKDNVISPDRLEQGKKEYRKEQKIFNKVSSSYHVNPHVILGIWGIETHFGSVEGKNNVFAALSTLAFDGRRSQYFKKELLTAIEIAGKTGMNPAKMTSSYAGAMGQPQFMPTAYINFATTGSDKVFFKHRYPDIWNNKKDALTSIANYLQKSGWDRETPWGEMVRVMPASGKENIFSGTKNYSTAPQHTLSEWETLGVYPITGEHFVHPELKGILFQPEGQAGESFMLYPNFKVIMRYNPSEFYALAAALLGDLSCQ
ncbi:lytic murein transglycosylase [Acetobacteraceae bacterium]|nr:lytic murein transglycosylase [Acetobacteraceae bacterium]